MTTSAPTFGHSPFGPREYWTRGRVLEELRAYARLHTGALPRAAQELDKIRKSAPDLPPARVIWKHFGSLVDAWLAVTPQITRERIPLRDGHVAWTDADDDLLLELAGKVPLAEIGRRLHRTWGACKVRLHKTHGTTARANQGYMSAGEIAREHQVSYSRVMDFLDRGRIAGTRSTFDNRWMVDPADITAEILIALHAPKHSHRPENGYATDHADYEQRYGLTRRRTGDGRVVRQER